MESFGRSFRVSGCEIHEALTLEVGYPILLLWMTVPWLQLVS
jgi:hypothetical protein